MKAPIARRACPLDRLAGVFFAPLSAFRFDLARVRFDLAGLYIERVFLQHLCREQLLQVVPEALVIVDHQL
jgi:hypothetical protein